MTQSGYSESSTIFSPLPIPEGNTKQATVQASTTTRATIEQIESSYHQTEQVFVKLLGTFRWWHYSTMLMHWLLFALGIGSLITAMIISLNHRSSWLLLTFVGLSMIIFALFFLYQAKQPIEKPVIYILWLNIIYNGYVSSLIWTIGGENTVTAINQIANQAFEQLQGLLDYQTKSK